MYGILIMIQKRLRHIYGNEEKMLRAWLFFFIPQWDGISKSCVICHRSFIIFIHSKSNISYSFLPPIRSVLWTKLILSIFIQMLNEMKCNEFIAATSIRMKQVTVCQLMKKIGFHERENLELLTTTWLDIRSRRRKWIRKTASSGGRVEDTSRGRKREREREKHSAWLLEEKLCQKFWQKSDAKQSVTMNCLNV